MNSLNDIWDQVCEILSKELTPTAMNTWFSDCEPLELEDCTLVLHTSSDFKRDIITARFADTIKTALSDLFAAPFELRILAGEEINDYHDAKKIAAEADMLPEMAGYTFDRFIVGNSNKFAHAAAIAVAEGRGKGYNPLFIYGSSGLGKTHLLLAIGHTTHERSPQTNIVYIKGDEFTNQMVKSLRAGTAEEFRVQYRNAELFLVDDIQFISGKESTQEEFFHTFNNIFEAGNQIVVTSDRPPKDMASLDDRLRSRFEGGLLADIQPPDVETRMAITRNKAAQLGLILSDDAVEYIAENITTNVRQIEGVIKRLTAYREILADAITIDSVKRAIKDVIRIGAFIPSPALIIRETARYYNLSEDEIRGQNRSKNVAIARQVSMYLIRTLTNIPLKDIGAEYEDRNHATVLSSVRKVEALLKSNPDMAATVRDITSNINSGS